VKASSARLLIAAVVAAVAFGRAFGQESRPADPAEFHFFGRVLFDDARLIGRVDLLDVRGVVATGACGADGAFELRTRVPPDGLRLRVGRPDAAPAFFDLSSDVRAGRIRLGLRDARSTRDGGDLGGVVVRGPPNVEVAVYDAGRGVDVDGRDEVARATTDKSGVVAFPDLKIEWVVFALQGESGLSDLVVAPGRFGVVAFGTDEPSSTTTTFASQNAAGALFAGFVETPYFAPGVGSPTRVRVDGRLRAAPDGAEGALLDLPPGAAFEGFVRTPEGDVHVRGFGGHGLRSFGVFATPVGFREARDVLDGVARRGERTRGGAVGVGPPASFAVATEAARFEPTYEAIVEPASSLDASSPPATLKRRSRVRVFAQDGLGAGEAWWRRRPGAPEALIAVSDPSANPGVFGGEEGVPIPSGEGEIVVRFNGGQAGIASVSTTDEDELLDAHPWAVDGGALSGRVTLDKKPVPGAAVFLVPAPEDRRLLTEFESPARRRDAAGRRAFEDARVVGATTDAEGNYACETVDKGLYALVVDAPGRRPFVPWLVAIPGEVRRDVSLDGVPDDVPTPHGTRPVVESRDPYGPTRVLAADAVERGRRATGDGFFLRETRFPTLPDPSGGFELRLRLAADDARTVMARVVSEEAGIGAFAASTRLTAEPSILRFDQGGRVVVQAAVAGEPWSTFGPYDLVATDDRSAPIALVAPGSARRVVGRARRPDGRPAADAVVSIYPEAARLLLGAEPDPIVGRVARDGSIEAPLAPPGRATLEIDAALGRWSIELTDVVDERLGEFVLKADSDADVAAFEASDDARYRSADGRTLDRREAERATRLRTPVERTAALRPEFGSRRPPVAARGAGSADGLLRRWPTREVVLAFPGYVEGAEVVLTPTTSRGLTAARPEYVGSLDGRGDARFDAVVPGRYVARYEDPNGERTVSIEIPEKGERRVVVPKPSFGRLVVAPFDAHGRKRLIGATVEVEAADAADATYGRGPKPLRGVVAGDGRAEIDVEAGRPLLVRVRSKTPGSAGLFRLPPLKEGETTPDVELMVPNATRLSVKIYVGSAPRTPAIGATAALYLDGTAYGVARSNAEGVAVFPETPNVREATLAVAAEGRTRLVRKFFGFGDADRFEIEVGIDAAAPTSVRLKGVEGAPIAPIFDFEGRADLFDARRSARGASLAAFADDGPDVDGIFRAPLKAFGGTLPLRVFDENGELLLQSSLEPGTDASVALP
jgi:hypothetical protein